MALAKRVTRSPLGRAVLAWVFVRYTGFVFATTRWQTLGREDADAMLRTGRPFIAAFWHNRLMMAPHGWQAEPTMHVIISHHRDGESIARVARRLGVAAIRGSRTRGGAAAFRASLRLLREGGYLGITPDGPRGPRMRVQPGIVALAHRSGAPIMPVTYAVSRRKLAESWDRFVIALPFGRGVYLWGSPIYVSADADTGALEDARRTLEERLNALTAEADRMVGMVPIEPALDAAESRNKKAGASPAAAHR